MHNHIWRIGSDPSAKETKKELLAIIIKCGSKGYWLRDCEFKFSKELQKEGLIKLCCSNEAAVII